MVRSVILETVMRDHKSHDTTHVHAHTHIYSHTHAHIDIDRYTHTYTHININTYTQVSPPTHPLFHKLLSLPL